MIFSFRTSPRTAEQASRIEVKSAPPIGIGVLLFAALVAALAGVPHPPLRFLAVFVVAFPLLWIALATFLSYTTACALHIASIEVPARLHALGSFRLAFTLTLGRHPIPAIGLLTNMRLSGDEATIEVGPSAEIPIIEVGRAATSEWDVFVKQRGILYVGPFRTAVELPGSAIRATAIFDVKRAVKVLPAVYQLQPFVDAMLAGRHLAVGRFQKLPTAVEEYVGAREYRPGDSPKLIHRVLSLRTRDPYEFYVREFQDPSRDDLALVLDTAPPLDGDDTLRRYRLEKAVAFVAALCRTFAARRLTVRFVYQRRAREVVALRLRPLDADIDRLQLQLMQIHLAGDRATIGRALLDEVRRHGAAVIFVSLRSQEPAEQQRLPILTLTPDHVPAFTREVVAQ
jgi:uncharacterized protein (DUF58 family)